MATIRDGGSTDNEDTAVTVIPEMSLPRPTVITLTPPAKLRMPFRKSAEETPRSILMVRTTLFMATSRGVLRTIRSIQQMTQDRAFQCGEVGRPAFPRPPNIHRHVMRNAAVLDHQDAVGERDRFRHDMRHQDCREGLLAPDPLQQQ